MKKELYETLANITDSKAATATPTVIQVWHDNISKHKDKLSNKYRLPLIKSIFNLFIKAFITSEKRIIAMARILDFNGSLLKLQYDALTEEEKLAYILLYSPKEEHFEKITQLNTIYKHFYLLRAQLRAAIANPISDKISHIITDVIESFKENNSKRLSTIMNQDPRVPSILGVVYLSEYRRRPIHPRRNDFLESATEWFGMSAQQQEPCSCYYFAAIIEKRNPQSKTVEEYRRTAEQHGYPIDEAFPPIGLI